MPTTPQPQIRTPEECLAEWHEKVALLDRCEQGEINIVYLYLVKLMNDHQSSAALAIVRMSLEISRQQQEMRQAEQEQIISTTLQQFGA